MKKLVCLVWMILLIAGEAMPRQVEISGKGINGNGLTIRAMAYADHVTKLRETLATATIGPEGHFHLSFQIAGTRYIWLDIAFQQAEMFVQPSGNYEVELKLLNDAISASYYDRFGLPMKIVRDDPDKLNLYIQDFNQLYNDFLLNYTDNIGPRSSSAVFETFNTAVKLRFQNAANPYLIDYIQYKMAGMQLFLRLKSRDNTGMEYISGKPVMYENIEYMEFFHLFFEKYFLARGKYFHYNKTFDLINGNVPLEKLLDTLKADPVLQDRETRELLLLIGLKELYFTSGFSKKRIESLIREMAVHAVSIENKAIAANLMRRLHRLQPGNPAPGFSARGVLDDELYTLEDFKGHYLYLAFFESGNLASQAELNMIDEISGQFGNKVKFVAVAVDADWQNLRHFSEDMKLTWQILHYGGDLQMLEDYDASTFPHFILIDDQGMILRSPAPSPSENIRGLFESL